MCYRRGRMRHKEDLFLKNLDKLSQQYQVLKEIGRGIEREALRVDDESTIATTPHPTSLGSALKNRWITTDFSESQLEFITPVNRDVNTLLAQLTDIHKYTADNIDDESLWPLSMPCFVGDEDKIKLAQYGTSNSGRMKHLYRQGLKTRYGSLMQIISGVHFNFSFPDELWDHWFGHKTLHERQDAISDSYFHVIRNYYRYGWLIPYFFGASPVLCGCFKVKEDFPLAFEKTKNGAQFLPNATSLRLSDLGYTNSAQSSLAISYNSLNEYLDGLHRSMQVASEDFAEKGLYAQDGKMQQLNTNVLQIENELYAPIRPKRVTENGQKPSEALAKGVEYVEIRSLDVDPFSATGISIQQVHFLDLFLVWCFLMPSEPLSEQQVEICKSNWQKIVLQGREDGIKLARSCSNEEMTLQEWGGEILNDLQKIATLFDKAQGGTEYEQNCIQLQAMLDDPGLTRSGQLLAQIVRQGGIKPVANVLAQQHKQQLLSTPYIYYHPEAFVAEAIDSLERQAEHETNDRVNFGDYLDSYFQDKDK